LLLLLLLGVFLLLLLLLWRWQCIQSQLQTAVHVAGVHLRHQQACGSRQARSKG
jgi:hypothetical protein